MTAGREHWCRDVGCLHYDHPPATASDAPVPAGGDPLLPDDCVRCERCDGTGDSTGGERLCGNCDGRGYVAAPVPAGAGDERAEVRVEWGVRWSSRSTWGYGTQADAEAAIAYPRLMVNGSDGELVRRTVTTSPWEPA